jgi:glycosyltransferase involved in cell wall biosynthesis
VTVREVGRRVAGALTAGWRPYSRLFLVGEGANWSIDRDLQAVAALAGRLDIDVVRRWPPGAARRQSLFYGSHFTYFDWPPAPEAEHRVAITYFHGRPGTPGSPEFDLAYEQLRRRREEIHRVQVTHRELEDIVLSSGIDRGKVFRIPIGVEPKLFRAHDAEARAEARRALGLPVDAFVVGSFQKDGVGWEEGLEPKLIKGPDVLVSTLAEVHRAVPELHVLLSGPARGYVKAGLQRHGIPYVHRLVPRYEEIGSLYAAVDAYVVASRQEGGPKGVLEAMAAGVPVVTTNVGQAPDLVVDGENGWIVPVDDVEALAGRLAAIAEHDAGLDGVIAAGLVTADANSYTAQLPLWRDFFDGFVGR